MITASPSPRPNPGIPSGPGSAFSPTSSRRISYEPLRKSTISSSPIVKPYSTHVDAAQQPTKGSSQWSRDHHSGSILSTNTAATLPSLRRMVDAGTQYSPPSGYRSPRPAAPEPLSIPHSVSLHIPRSESHTAMPPASQRQLTTTEQQLVENQPNGKRQASTSETSQPQNQVERQINPPIPQEQGPTKRLRGDAPAIKIMPIRYETCDTRDLVTLISSMLMELIRYNDAIPLKDGHLTRFHSRAPPGISVQDYLQRLTTHATLPPPILLSMVYYIDKLCNLYPAFTISSLTVHRFLITSATVASKGLSDSFWTNKTYARVGGVSVKELALLEMEFLVRVQWRIVPKPEILVDYYRSLVQRSPGYEIEQEPVPP